MTQKSIKVNVFCGDNQPTGTIVGFVISPLFEPQTDEITIASFQEMDKETVKHYHRQAQRLADLANKVLTAKSE